MNLKNDPNLFEDPDIVWQRLSREFKSNPHAKTKFGEELWIVSFFFCFYNREFHQSFLICNKHLNELDKQGIDVVVKAKNGSTLGIQAKQFPTSSVIENRKKYQGSTIIHINKDYSAEYLQRNTEEIERMTVSYLKEKLRNDYDFVVIYLNTVFEKFAWLENVMEKTRLKRAQIRTKEVWAFKNEKITVPLQDLDKIAHLHPDRYRFFRLFPSFKKYNYEFRESPNY